MGPKPVDKSRIIKHSESSHGLASGGTIKLSWPEVGSSFLGTCAAGQCKRMTTKGRDICRYHQLIENWALVQLNFADKRLASMWKDRARIIYYHLLDTHYTGKWKAG